MKKEMKAVKEFETYLLVMVMLKYSLAYVSGSGGLERMRGVWMPGTTMFFVRTSGTFCVP